MPLVTRAGKGSPLTWAEGDANLTGLADGSLITGSWRSRGITDAATTTALSLSGSGSRYITLANSATTPKIITGGGATVPLDISTIGGAVISLLTNNLKQVEIQHTAAATRYITLTGSAAGNPIIGTSAGSLAVSSALVGSSSLSASTFISAGQYLTAYGATATPAGGHAQCAVYFTSDAIAIQVGSGAPTTTPANGSIYIRTDGGASTTIYQRRAGSWVATNA